MSPNRHEECRGEECEHRQAAKKTLALQSRIAADLTVDAEGRDIDARGGTFLNPVTD